jgi:fucose permease
MSGRPVKRPAGASAPVGREKALIPLFITLSAFAVSANAIAPLLSTVSGETMIPAETWGGAVTLQFLSFFVASFCGDLFRKKHGLSNRALILAGLVLISIELAIGPWAIRREATLLPWIAALGIAGGLVETFSSVEISKAGNPDSSRNICLSQAFYSIGALASPQLVYLFFLLGISWKCVMPTLGLFSAAVALYFLHRGRRGPLARAEKDAAIAGRDSRDVAIGAAPDFARSNKGFLLGISLTMFFYVALEGLSASWIPFMFEKRLSTSPARAALVLVLFQSGMIGGRLFAAYLPPRHSLWPAFRVALAATAVVSVLSASIGTAAVRIACMALLGFAAGPIWPVMVMISRNSSGSERITSRLIGIGALGFATGPLLGSGLHRLGADDRFFAAQAALAAATLGAAMIAFAYRGKNDAQGHS